MTEYAADCSFMRIKIVCHENGQKIRYERTIDTFQYTAAELLQVIESIDKLVDNSGKRKG